ncbi:E3 ISG15-protein ligase HERC5-like protein, partial [Euroglyphus maynei]
MAKKSTNKEPQQQHSEYEKFNFITKQLRIDDPSRIKLMTKIYNRDTTSSKEKHHLSIIWMTNDNKCFAYGNNKSGCLGINESITVTYGKPALIREISENIIKLCSGQHFVLALTDNGRCYSWGDNRFGQLGKSVSRSNSNTNRPTLIDSIKDPIVDIACGLLHSLILTVTNHLYSFGSNLTGSVGNGTTFHQTKPVRLTDFTKTPSFGGVDFVGIACGGWHSAAVNLKVSNCNRFVNCFVNKGEIFVWGWNSNGQCGQDALKTNVLSPTKLKINAPIKSVCCGQSHTLMLTYDGKVYAMGSNQRNQCGSINAEINCTKPVLVPIDEPIEQIGAWAKSDISIAKSMLMNGKFFIWGSMKQNETLSNHQSDNNGQQKNLIHKISLCSFGILSPKYQTMNQILAYFDKFSITDDHKLLRSRYQLNFPFERILIQHNNDNDTMNNKLLETFNNQNDCDTAIGFVDASPSSSPGQQKFNSERIIYAQQLLLERLNNFFQRLPKSWIIDAESKTSTPSPPPTEEESTDQPQSLSGDIFATDGIRMTKFIQTLNRQRKRFNLLILDRNLVNERAMYAYIMFQYSSQRFLIIAKQDLIELIRIAELMDDKLLMDCCLNYIVNKCPDRMEQLCSLFSQSIRLELTSVMDFC